MDLIILAIESSCDETSASVISNGKVLNNIIASQSIHQKYGGVVPELEAFDGGMVNYALYLITKKFVEAPHYFNLILGNPFNAQADPLSLGTMLSILPPHSLWGVGGIGGADKVTVVDV